jgi:hypothetical protein
MADTKISQLTQLTAPATDDELVVVDKSDTTMAASGTDKRAAYSTLFPSTAITVPNGPIVDVPTSNGAGAANTFYVVQILVPSARTITGIRYRVGATSSGNVRAALYDSAGDRIADRTTDLAQAAANGLQTVAFDSPIAIAPGLYYALLWFSAAASTHVAAVMLVVTRTATNAGGTPASTGVPAVSTGPRPILTTY